MSGSGKKLPPASESCYLKPGAAVISRIYVCVRTSKVYLGRVALQPSFWLTPYPAFISELGIGITRSEIL